jgi:hypothetical protein
MANYAQRAYIWALMFKRSIILLSFLAYWLTLVHSIVPHLHHDKPTSKQHHHHDGSKDHDHDDHQEKKSVSHAFADAIHFPGSDVTLHGPTSDNVQKIFFVVKICSDNLMSLLSQQLKPPDRNADYRQTHYSAFHYSLFLLRAPPVA